MISLYDYRTEDALPAEMKTPERLASCRAFDMQKKKFLDRLKRVYIWADLDNVEDDKLDFLAVENRVLFYNTNLPPDTKRSLIRNSIYWYMKLGTSQAMTEMIDTVFGSKNTSVEEWYTYAGEPYHFRIAVGTEVTTTSIKEFLIYLNKVKNARSRFDYLAFQNGITLKFLNKSEYQIFLYTFCGEFECGTYPITAVGFQPAEVQITLETEGEGMFAEYTQAGTVPDIATGLQLSQTTVNFEGGTEGQTIVYPTDSDQEAGSYPGIAAGLQLAEVTVDLEGETEGQTIVYPTDSGQEAGTYPDSATGFASAESGVSVAPESEGFNLYYDTNADKYAANEE